MNPLLGIIIGLVVGRLGLLSFNPINTDSLLLLSFSMIDFLLELSCILPLLRLSLLTFQPPIDSKLNYTSMSVASRLILVKYK